MEKKTTKREYFNQLLGLEEVKTNQELIDFIEHEIELLDKKRTSSTKAKPEDEELMNLILDAMEENSIYRAKDIVESLDNKYTSPKVVAYLKKLMECNKVGRKEEKGVAYFFLKVEG